MEKIKKFGFIPLAKQKTKKKIKNFIKKKKPI